MDIDKKNPITEPADLTCDVKSWQGSCEHSDYTRQGDKYLCNTCGKIANLDHEIHHDHFPHLSGDTSKLH